MIKLGLTGSIAMGKSTAAALLKDMGVPVFDADDEVRKLLERTDVIAAIKKKFPTAVTGNKLDKKKLREKAFSDHQSLDHLEQLLHPFVKQSRDAFYQQHAAEGYNVSVVDIPLLFETGADKEVDYTLVMTAPKWVQKKRVLQRPNMTPDFLAFLQERQMTDAEKRKRADFVITSAFGKKITRFFLHRLINQLKNEAKRKT